MMKKMKYSTPQTEVLSARFTLPILGSSGTMPIDKNGEEQVKAW